VLLMRRYLIGFVCLVALACGDSGAGLTSAGTLVDISGAWLGAFTSSNNEPQQIVVSLSQTGPKIDGTWRAEMVNWTGQVIGDVDGSSFSGQLTFNGTVSDQTICTGTASITGPVTRTSISWSSAPGVVGDSCPAPLPVAIRIDLHR
jgi:hypothetical protein